MASIANDPNGRKRILFIGADGKRRAIRLGKASVRLVEAFNVKVEQLVSARILGHAPDDETSRWLADLDDTIYARLAAVDLVKPRQPTRYTLKQLLDFFFQHLNVKPITVLGYQPRRAALL